MNPKDINPTDLEERTIGPVTILFGYENGKYPFGNSMVIRGSQKRVMVDPCLGVVARREQLPEVDLVLHSHTHEDHIAGTHLFPDLPWLAHEADALGLESIDGLMEIYGLFEGEVYESFKREVDTTYYYPHGGEVTAFSDGDTFDFGGVTVTVIHTPGHTRGHCCFLIEWGEAADEKLVYLGDIELTGFGPYYGDAWSDLEDFEASIQKLHDIDARWWLTFHHKGLVDGREKFLGMLDAFSAVINDRETRLVEFIGEPRTMDEIVEHRFVYRPGQTGFLVDEIERRSMGMHIDRLIRSGKVVARENQFVVSRS